MKTKYKKFRVAVFCLFSLILISIAALAMPTHLDTYLTVNAPLARIGEEVDVTISLIGNPGIAGFSLRVYYDEDVLTPLYVTDNPWLGGHVFVSNVNERVSEPQYEWRYDYYYGWVYEAEPILYAAPSLTAVWGASYNVTTEELFTIRFRVNDHAPIGESYISLFVIDLMDEYREDVHAHVYHGAIDVRPFVWGNVTGTGYVHIGDMIRVAQHLAEIPGMELYGEEYNIADVDRDGRVTVADLILIAQHLANPYVERGTYE